MSVIARFVTRMGGENDGLFIGSSLKVGRKFFDENSVYEIIETLGEITIRKVGKCHERVNWNQNIETVMACNGKYLFLTEHEYEAECEMSNGD